jgi:hypothetical protein
VDWKKKGLWTHQKSAVRSQTCGNCWAAATSSLMEAHSEIKGYNRSFSMQELTLCTPNPFSCGGGGGCSGATSEVAMQYALMNGLGERPAVERAGSEGGGSEEDGLKALMAAQLLQISADEDSTDDDVARRPRQIVGNGRGKKGKKEVGLEGSDKDMEAQIKKTEFSWHVSWQTHI